ncbi:MAG: LTA synthase family protein [Bacteroidetes bacterium]|nr:LTA synthase family protein [Bacteroidota bacterium]
MKNNPTIDSLKKTAKSLLLLLALYCLCRLLFLLFNFSYFADLKITELLLIFSAGLRFDISAILICNLPFILFSVFPLLNKANGLFQKLLKTWFISSNAVCLLLNCIDFAYFKFTLKRATAELFFMHDDVGNLLAQYLVDYWYIGLIWIALVYLLIRFYPKSLESYAFKLSFPLFLMEVLILLLTAASCLLGIRGGFQLKPLRIITAAEYTEVKNIPLVINTPFSLIKTIESESLVKYQFYTDKEIEQEISFIHPADSANFTNQNVVVIILESFSKEYIGNFNQGKGYTPFLDSLLKKGTTFRYSFSNAKKSIEGIPAIVSGIPSLMENPYITSMYGSNQLQSLPSLLKQKGYTTSFYHGGNNGTMGFDAFTKIAGFDNYFGRNEYANEADFDGNWGIYDEPFLHYFEKQMQSQKQPFCNVLFTLSSHHPYSIPVKYKNRFPKGTLEIHESIGYTDYALQQFFKKASQSSWYANTLFVITADHTSIAESPYYKAKIGSYAIPILLFHPTANLPQLPTNKVVQQIDIMPTILDLLNFDKPYFAYGKSVYDTTTNHYVINYFNGVYQSSSSTTCLFFDGEKTRSFYDLTQDSILSKNILDSAKAEQKKQEVHLKKFVQQFNKTLLQNKMTAK